MLRDNIIYATALMCAVVVVMLAMFLIFGSGPAREASDNAEQNRAILCHLLEVEATESEHSSSLDAFIAEHCT